MFPRKTNMAKAMIQHFNFILFLFCFSYFFFSLPLFTFFFSQFNTFYDYNDQLSILQWNIRGLISNHNMLDQLIYKYKPNFICIQEGRVHYNIDTNTYWTTHRPKIPNYKCIYDPIIKTIIFYKDNFKATELKLKYLYYNGNQDYTTITKAKLEKLTKEEKKNVIYHTYLAIETQFINGFNKEK